MTKPTQELRRQVTDIVFNHAKRDVSHQRIILFGNCLRLLSPSHKGRRAPRARSNEPTAVKNQTAAIKDLDWNFGQGVTSHPIKWKRIHILFLYHAVWVLQAKLLCAK